MSLSYCRLSLFSDGPLPTKKYFFYIPHSYHLFITCIIWRTQRGKNHFGMSQQPLLPLNQVIMRKQRQIMREKSKKNLYPVRDTLCGRGFEQNLMKSISQWLPLLLMDGDPYLIQTRTWCHVRAMQRCMPSSFGHHRITAVLSCVHHSNVFCFFLLFLSHTRTRFVMTYWFVDGFVCMLLGENSHIPEKRAQDKLNASNKDESTPYFCRLALSTVAAVSFAVYLLSVILFRSVALAWVNGEQQNTLVFCGRVRESRDGISCSSVFFTLAPHFSSSFSSLTFYSTPFRGYF